MMIYQPRKISDDVTKRLHNLNKVVRAAFPTAEEAGQTLIDFWRDKHDLATLWGADLIEKYERGE